MTQAPHREADFWRSLLERNARTRGDAPALSRRLIGGRHDQVSHRELLSLVDAYADLFAATTRQGQVIPLCLARGPACVAAMLGALVSGRAFSCLNQKLRAPQLSLIFDLLDSPVALIDGQGLQALTSDALSVPSLLSTSWQVVLDQPLARSAEQILAQLESRAEVARHGLAPRAPNGGSADTTSEPTRHEYAGAGCCLFTSGSTGVPKGVLIGGDDLIQRARVEVSWLGLSSNDVLLSILPFSFDVGLNQLLASLVAGAELVILESWLPADILSVVAARGVTGIAAVPSIWIEFMKQQRVIDRAHAHRSLRFLTVSGGDLSAAQHVQLLELAGGAEIFKTYGQTETFRTSSLRPEEYAGRPLSVGKALPGVRLYICRADGTRAEVGEAGEVVHTGTGSMLGYLGADATPAKLRENPWRSADDPNPLAVFTGDIGRLDEEGYLYLLGRRDDLVKISGNRVYPSEVQTLLTALPGLAAAEVLALRTEDAARLVAFVIPIHGATLTGDGLRRQLKDRAPSYMVPELFVLRADLPRTASGKPDRTLLMAQARELLERGSPPTLAHASVAAHAAQRDRDATSR